MSWCNNIVERRDLTRLPSKHHLRWQQTRKPLAQVRQVYPFSGCTTRFLPRLPVFYHVYPVFNTSTRFHDSDFQKNWVVLLPVNTGKIHKTIKHFVYKKQQSNVRKFKSQQINGAFRFSDATAPRIGLRLCWWRGLVLGCWSPDLLSFEIVKLNICAWRKMASNAKRQMHHAANHKS